MGTRMGTRNGVDRDGSNEQMGKRVDGGLAHVVSLPLRPRALVAIGQG